MNTKITCPNCQFQFDVDEVLGSGDMQENIFARAERWLWSAAVVTGLLTIAAEIWRWMYG